MRLFFFLLFACLLLLKEAPADSDPLDPFEGKLIYEIDSGGMDMTYTLWFKESKWRSELRAGKQLFELRIGDSEEQVAFLVNDGGNSYRAVSGPRFGPGGAAGNQPPNDHGPGKKGKGPKPIDLEKVASLKDEVGVVIGYETRLDVLKGPGKKLDFWWAEMGPDLPDHALPRVKALEEKSMLLPVYLNSRFGLPLLIDAGLSGKKAFRMELVSLAEEAVELEFVSLPDGYKMEAGMMPGGGGPGGRPRGGPPGGRPSGGMPPM